MALASMVAPAAEMHITVGDGMVIFGVARDRDQELEIVDEDAAARRLRQLAGHPHGRAVRRGRRRRNGIGPRA